MKRLVAHLRVFFDKRSGKAERIEQFVAERGIEYGLQFVTQFSLNSPDCLYLKKSCKFLQSYEKTREKPNLFELFRMQRTSAKQKNVTPKEILNTLGVFPITPNVMNSNSPTVPSAPR